MHKVVLLSLLAAAGAGSFPSLAAAQAAGSTGAAGATGSTGQVQMSQEEYTAYQKAVNDTAPAQKAADFEAYLKAYPNSAVKSEALNQLLFAYSQTGDQTKTLDAADRLLAVDPQNLRALTFEVFYGRQSADKLSDPAAKQAALDKVAGYAQQGLNATAPKGMSDADFQALKGKTTPVFESAIADDDMSKKDNAGAITALKAELAAVPPEQTQQVGPVLQDEYQLANAYYTSTPPDYLNCAYYAARTAGFAPAAQSGPITTLANYCYSKYHGSKEGFDQFQQTAKSSPTPPATLATTVTAAPKPEDVVKNLIATTPDLATLALSDKEFVLQYGQQADADKVFDTIKGKTVEIPNAIVVAATADQLQVAVSDDAKNSNPKTPDFTFAMKAPLTTVPAVGSPITLSGTYASYTQTPTVMITMSDGAVVEPKKAAPAPTRRAPARRR